MAITKSSGQVMMKNKIPALVILSLFAAFNGIACAKLQPDKGGSPEKSIKYISICKVLKQKDYFLGKKVRFKAMLETDYSNYGYFENKQPADNECVGNNIIPIASISVMHDKSVMEFVDSNHNYCKKHGMTLCVISVDVDFEAKLLKDEGGFYLFITKIFSYRYSK